MKILPAIDLKDGKCVRLNKGDYKQVTHYSNNPLNMAETWIRQGANNLHIVDLDGAKAGKPINFTIIESIRKEFPNLFIQVGGGIRNQENIDRYIDVGIDKVIIGTKVVADPEFIKKIDANLLNKIIVDVAVKDEMLAVQGWNESSSYNINEFIIQIGVWYIILYRGLNEFQGRGSPVSTPLYSGRSSIRQMAYISRKVQSESSSHLGSFLTGCLAGAIIGGVLGVLLAPHRGDITRRKVARKAEETKEQVIEVVVAQFQ